MNDIKLTDEVIAWIADCCDDRNVQVSAKAVQTIRALRDAAADVCASTTHAEVPYVVQVAIDKLDALLPDSEVKP